MQLQDNLLAASDEDFTSIYKVLMQSPEKRKEFFRQPERVLSEKGLKINAKRLEQLKKIVGSLHMNKEKAQFNEKLVLCSSSGY